METLQWKPSIENSFSPKNEVMDRKSVRAAAIGSRSAPVHTGVLMKTVYSVYCLKNQEASFKTKSRFVGQKSCR